VKGFPANPEDFQGAKLQLEAMGIEIDELKKYLSSWEEGT
jgi:S-adenosylhomocysteine hydrolase